MKSFKEVYNTLLQTPTDNFIGKEHSLYAQFRDVQENVLILLYCNGEVISEDRCSRTSKLLLEDDIDELLEISEDKNRIRLEILDY